MDSHGPEFVNLLTKSYWFN